MSVDAQTATAPDDPRREIRLGLIAVFAFFGLFLGWAAFAPMDAGAHAQGVVAVSGNRQAVQHREGGVVSDLKVREGDRVEAGQVLLELSAADLAAEERALAERLLALQATQARLQAEREGRAAITPPPSFSTLPAGDRPVAERAMRLERAQLTTRHGVLVAQRGVLTQRVAQLSQQIIGFDRQSEANREQQRLLDEELVGTKSLAERGYAPLTRVRALERGMAELHGQDGALQAETARTRDAIGEARLQLSQYEKQHLEEVIDQQRQVAVQIGEVEPRLAAARDRLARAQVRAPAAGRVVGLKVFTKGGVVAPGDVLMEVVPEDASLVIQANVTPDNADQLHPGMEADIRFPSLHERGLRSLRGTVTKVSADSFVDERTGARFYRLTVVAPPDELAEVRRMRGAAAGVKPGLPVEVVLPFGHRTALDYLIDPLNQTLWRSFRER